MWFIDRNSPNHLVYHRVKKQIASVRTRYQNVEILDTYEFGRMVILDGHIQSAESDEFIYHEMLVHPAMLTHPKPEQILILGGGEGATLREVLRHPTVKRAVMVDIDGEFVDLCKRYLKKWHRGSFSDGKAVCVYADAFAYLRNNKEGFDVIIGDISDPAGHGPSRSIYTMKCYSLIRKALKTDGIFVTHAAAVYHVPHRNYSGGIIKKLMEIFPNVDLYCDYIPSFSALWSYAAGSCTLSPAAVLESLIERRVKQRGIQNLAYYTPQIHKRLFVIPPCLEKNILVGQRVAGGPAAG